jgi:hypothetical protein
LSPQVSTLLVMSDKPWFKKNPFKFICAKLKKKPCTCNMDKGKKPTVMEIQDEDSNSDYMEWKPHTQVDYRHYLVPGLTKIFASPHYWGKMDRYEAEKALEDKPEGSFLLRDSAQEEYIFSVSFRRYGRSLHARIEEADHKFSFDCHDPGVFRSWTIPQLLYHYKDPNSCMFFEPLLSCPVNRNEPFSLQDISRAHICDRLRSYSSIDKLELPRGLKCLLKEYHYKHRIRTRRLD